MSDSLIFAGIELLNSSTYRVLDGQRNFGDPQAITAKIRSELSVGSFVTGDATDNRTITFQIAIFGANRTLLAQADSALRAAVNSSGPKTLVWTPEATGLPTIWDVYRGQVQTAWSKKYEAAGIRVVTITMDALPYGRSDTQHVLTGTQTTIELADFTANPEYSYHTNTTSAPLPLQPYDVTCGVSGTPYAPITANPAPINGVASMRMDLYSFFDFESNAWYSIGEIDTVTGTWDLSDAAIAQVAFSLNRSWAGFGYQFVLTLTDSSGATARVFTSSVGVLPTATWAVATFNLTTLGSLDMAHIVSWKLRFYTLAHVSSGSPIYIPLYLGLLEAYPTSSQQASTSHGAVLKIADVGGDARADASIAFDRGGTNTITGFLVYRAPSGTPATTPSLLGLIANSGTTPAPSTFRGTYRILLANAGGANMAAGQTLTITQKIGATTVATKTLTSTAVAGGTAWADCGDVTLPLVDVPIEASNITYTFAHSAAATEVLICDTRGFLAWVPVTAAVKYVWVDEATANRAGAVFGGASSDRSDATSLLGLSGAQAAGAPSLDPGDDYLLVYVIDGAASNVTVSYYTRWLGERVSPVITPPTDADLFLDTFLDVF